MIKRNLEPILRSAAAKYPVVSLTGPRQAGKTTLVRMAFPDYAYASLEDPDLRSFALEDPRGFLDQFSGRVILDEAQRVPDLFSYIQTIVDKDDASGKYILTGSQNFLLHQRVSQSLAGRCAVLHLMPFSLSELEGRKALPISAIGVTLPKSKRRSSTDLVNTLHRGFYPRIHDKALDPTDWLRNYFLTYVERDVRDLVNVGDLDAFERFVRLCAGRNGMLLNLSSIGNDCGISHTTTRRWVSILEAAFIVVLLRPHSRNFSKRLIKSPKLYFLDTGLLCYLLRIRDAKDLGLHAMRGSVFESFVISELVKNYTNQGLEQSLYFWRDSGGNEIDVVIEDGGNAIPLEIKSAQTVAPDFLDGIEYWRDLSGNAEHPAALIYGGDRSFRRSGVCVYSWTVL
jgi:predicted AAA+ superfamily ATPase